MDGKRIAKGFWKAILLEGKPRERWVNAVKRFRK
jgi:hypothetical protein